MTEMLLRFFEFDRWANHETMHSLEQMTNPLDRALALIAHIAATQRLWFERVLSVPQSKACSTVPTPTILACPEEPASSPGGPELRIANFPLVGHVQAVP